MAWNRLSNTSLQTQKVLQREPVPPGSLPPNELHIISDHGMPYQIMFCMTWHDMFRWCAVGIACRCRFGWEGGVWEGVPHTSCTPFPTTTVRTGLWQRPIVKFRGTWYDQTKNTDTFLSNHPTFLPSLRSPSLERSAKYRQCTTLALLRPSLGGHLPKGFITTLDPFTIWRRKRTWIIASITKEKRIIKYSCEFFCLSHRRKSKEDQNIYVYRYPKI